MKNYLLKIGIACIGFIQAISCSNDDTATTNTSLINGKDISTYASLTANKSIQKSEFSVLNNGNWKLYEGDNSNFNFDIPLLQGTSEGKYLLDNQIFKLYCFEWKDGSRNILGLRQLPIEGQPNFRDLGGYKTRDGKYVKWGAVFRSGKCNILTSNDLSYLSTIPLKTIIDFRSESERTFEPDRVPTSVKTQIQLPIEPGNLSSINISDVLANGDVASSKQFLVDANKILVLNFQNEYKTFFAHLMNQDSKPIMFHCTAGKDRAGLAAALFLSSLGVDRETVIQDYLLTNTLTGVTMESMKAKYGDNATAECMYYLYSVQKEYIEAAFSTIEKEYGSVENYLTQQLNVDLNLMKSLYLY
ncbi:tyrosine-protein phosphatase [Apibacter raozihei]|uniref:tyrosine-protein phosphatase n=1 Tax=Apibacter raozihei TaxID=2500547 RepID=UPI000FE406F6|nr:tyrosine-protein phosphatase [Apibacter raozihei]